MVCCLFSMLFVRCLFFVFNVVFLLFVVCLLMFCEMTDFKVAQKRFVLEFERVWMF